MKYICDNHRHLVCLPYSIDNLHDMAEQLNIKRCWFHKDHYDIPKRRINEIQWFCTITSPQNIVRIRNNSIGTYAEFIIAQIRLYRPLQDLLDKIDQNYRNRAVGDIEYHMALSEEMWDEYEMKIRFHRDNKPWIHSITPAGEIKLKMQWA